MLTASTLIACTGGGGNDNSPPAVNTNATDTQAADVAALDSVLGKPPSASQNSNANTSQGGRKITSAQIQQCANLPEMSPVDMSRATCFVGAFDGWVYDRAARRSTDQPCHSEFTASGQLVITTNTARISQVINPLKMGSAGGSKIIHGNTFLGVGNIPTHSILNLTDGSFDQGYEQAAAQFTDQNSGRVRWLIWSSISTSVARKEQLDCAVVLEN